MHLAWAVTCVRRTPRRRRGRACGFNPPAFMPRIKARRFLWEVGTSYNERRFLWGVIRFVQAVTCVRTAPPVRAEEGAGSARRASPLLCALAASAACGDSMGGDMLCLGCILRKENPAPQARIACGADQSAFMPRLANTAGAEDSMGSGTLCLGCNLREDSPARQGGKGCRLSLPRHMAATASMGSGTPCASCNLRKDSPAPAVLARRERGCRLSLPGQPAFMRTCRIRGVRDSCGRRYALYGL